MIQPQVLLIKDHHAVEIPIEVSEHPAGRMPHIAKGIHIGSGAPAEDQCGMVINSLIQIIQHLTLNMSDDKLLIQPK